MLSVHLSMFLAYFQCLFYNELPYAEDVRQYTFSSLPLKDDSEINKKLKPTDEQCDLMDQLITNMDLNKKYVNQLAFK